MTTFKFGPPSPAMVSVVRGGGAWAVELVNKVPAINIRTSYLESLLNMERNDARLLRLLFFCKEEALEDTEGAADKADVVEWRCLKFAGK